MTEKKTGELEKVLGSIHPEQINEFFRQNSESMVNSSNDFSVYMKELMHAHGLSQQETFLLADIPERYGYKLLSGEKHTQQRDTVLRICYAAKFTLEETQRALKKYCMPELYAKIPRDALLMVCFNERPGSIIDVNTYLKKNGMEILRSSGTID